MWIVVYNQGMRNSMTTIQALSPYPPGTGVELDLSFLDCMGEFAPSVSNVGVVTDSADRMYQQRRLIPVVADLSVGGTQVLFVPPSHIVNIV